MGKNSREAKRGGGAEGWWASLDRGFGEKDKRENRKKACPSVRQIGKEFRGSKRLHLKACGATDAQDKSTRCTVCLHKTQIPSASKSMSFPWSIWAGVCSSGPTELVCESITKTAFQRIRGTMGSFSFADFNKTDSNIDSPADTCGCGVPKGLKMSLSFSPPLIRAQWKQQYISLVLCTQYEAKSEEVGSSKQRKKRAGAKTEKDGSQDKKRFGLKPNSREQDSDVGEEGCLMCIGDTDQARTYMQQLRHVFWLSEPLKSHYTVQQQRLQAFPRL